MTTLLRRFFCAINRYFNCYLIGDFIGIAGVIAFFGIPEDEGAIAMLLFLLCGIIQLINLHLPSCVINKTCHPIFVKERDSAAVYSVEPNSYIGFVDGVKVNKNVYMIPQGVRLVVNKRGKIRIYSLIGCLSFYHACGKQNTQPNNSWRPLFEA